MKYILRLLLVILLTNTILFAESFQKPPYDERLNLKVDGKLWYDNADTEYSAAYNLGVFYQKELKDYKLAEFWYKQAISLNSRNTDAIYNLAYLYEDKKEYIRAIKWYKKAIERESLDAMKNLSLLYYSQKKYVQAVEYMLPLSDRKYTKKKVFALFRTHWKFSEATIKKGYEAQLKSTIIPEKLKYKGGI
ncbi:tetratricopeptide repeat protein [Sulfurimonas sp. HSL3-2]|uniref:tetratricopeptide repeat protein n=1 Tax=Hydrocurvibacter mobilis TaxID=3131936 RepID=UPI0031F92300